MKIKSYFAQTVEEAMATARQELGPEAMLVNSRKAPPEARGMGEYEVVFAEAEVEQGSAASRGGNSGSSRDGHDHLSAGLAELKQELEVMRRAMTRSALAPAEYLAQSAELADAYAVLAGNEVAPELAREIVEAASERTGLERGGGRRRRWDSGELNQAVLEEMAARIQVEPALGAGESRPRIVALVGPPGCGKTTSLVKLAVNFGLAARRPSLLFTLDTYRVAAAEQLRSYAAILGLGFQVFETVGALSQAIEENRGKELIFVDTPGLGLQELEPAPVFAAFLTSRKDIDTHLVLPASMKAADLARMVDAYERFQPAKLLFTRLDETSCYGAVFTLAARSKKPLSFFGNGQRIPEDLETATAARVTQLVFSGRSARALSAA